MSFLTLEPTDSEALKEFLGGAGALPNSLSEYGNTVEECVSKVRDEGVKLLETSAKSNDPIFARRKASLLFALARDIDRYAAGDRTLRGQGFSDRLRMSYETGRGLLDHEQEEV